MNRPMHYYKLKGQWGHNLLNMARKKKVLKGREGRTLPGSVESNCGKSKEELRAVTDN